MNRRENNKPWTLARASRQFRWWTYTIRWGRKVRGTSRVLDRIQLLRNVGQFDSVSAGASLPFGRLTLIYAENGRGKTTLAAILRSLASGDPVPIAERQRLAASNPPHVVLKPSSGPPVIFQSGAWSRPLPDIAVFDDTFVAANVCSGLEVDAEHRQNLHELILGAKGVALSNALQEEVAKVEAHNKELRAKADAISAAARGSLSVDAFCALPPRADIDVALHAAEQGLAAAEQSAAVGREPGFDPLSLPEIDPRAVAALLKQTLPDLEAAAAERVQAHLSRLGPGGEAWAADGLRRVADDGKDENSRCPFCAQDLRASPVILHYRAYFGQAYADLKSAVAAKAAELHAAHDGEAVAAFERAVRVAVERRAFWSAFADVPEFAIDTAAIARARKAVAILLIDALEAKQGAPLEALPLPGSLDDAMRSYDTLRQLVLKVSAELVAANERIALAKERASTSDAATLRAELALLRATRARHEPATAAACDAYLLEKLSKEATEQRRDEARRQLDAYRAGVFPAYEQAINTYLGRFGAGFRLTQVTSANTRAGSACNYSVLVNAVSVPLTPGSTPRPSFKTALSAGDRNTLALAFFLASLDRDPRRSQKVVVIDDPMTSLDEHRSLTTIQEVRRLASEVAQVVVLSHAKSFLCPLWQERGANSCTAIKITRDAVGSTLAAWDVSQDCVTLHDKRYALVRDYMAARGPCDERAVAVALRPILEQFMRVAYADVFPPESLLGPFIGRCAPICGTANEILPRAALAELRSILDYANTFHHDTNPAWETAAINDAELLNFCGRVMAFVRHA